MDSEKASPVESQNSIVHKKLDISSNFDTHKGVKWMSENSTKYIKNNWDNAI